MSDIINRINEDYMNLLHKSDSSNLATEFERMQKRMRMKRCLAGKNVLPTYIKPIFFTTKQLEYFQSIVEILLTCQEKLINLYFKSPDYKNLFELTEEEKPLMEIKTHLPRWIYFSRLDSIMNNDDIKFLEFNCDSPGGAYYTDIQTDCLLGISIMKKLKKKYPLIAKVYRPLVIDTLLKAWKEFGGKEKPSIAVMGNPNVTNVEEFRLFAEYFESKGYISFFTDPWRLEYDGKQLTSMGRKIDLIYRRGILADYSKHVDETKPVIDAYRDGKVCFVNPLGAKLGDNKNLLSVLTDEKTRFLFTDEEFSTIKKHIPWTRMVRECKTTFENKNIDLVPFMRANKDRLVIKPNSEYGGKGVVIGIDSDTNTWDNAIDNALTQPMVTQEYVEIPSADFPVFDPDLSIKPKKVNINFLTYAGKFGGGFARTSDSLIINVSRGGALVPFIFVDG
jgi:glutathionylspermidine synthase